MPRTTVDAYVEQGTKRVFAGALEWPGWARSARDEVGALRTLQTYAPRYAAVIKGMRPAFGKDPEPKVVEHLTGDATTDFGAPSMAPAADARPVDRSELARLRRILERCWAALDRAADAATGRELTKGPRGGGRDLQAIVGHVVSAEAAYCAKIAAKRPAVEDDDLAGAADEVHAVALDALTRAVTDGLPAAGPRGGKIWLPRYFVRRAAWHVLDHAWEIEDRTE